MSQIFQTNYPKSEFFDFLDKFCEKNQNQYIFSKEAFKRIKLEEQIVPQTFVYSSTFDILFHRVGELKEEDIASIVEMIQSEDSQ